MKGPQVQYKLVKIQKEFQGLKNHFKIPHGSFLYLLIHRGLYWSFSRNALFGLTIVDCDRHKSQNLRDAKNLNSPKLF